MHATFLRVVVASIFLGLLASPLRAVSASPTSFVDPFIGTAPNPLEKIGYAWDTGNVFPGAVCPRGMLAWSPDTTHDLQIAGGYWYPDHQILDFSLTHFSGRGVPCLKDIAFMPLIEEVKISPGVRWNDYAATFSHQNESALPGYYRVKFDNGIETELAATPRCGIGSFRFPSQSANPAVLMRANGSITVNGDEASGYAANHIGKGGSYQVYFFAHFNQKPKNVKSWTGDQIASTNSAIGANCGAIISFDRTPAPLLIRVGISYTSAENARENLRKEISDWNADAVRHDADDLWEHELKRIEIDGGTTGQRKTFYTALYHCFIHPNLLDDANGQYLGMDQKIHNVEPGHHQYQNIPAWDEYRSLSPLIAIVAPHQASDVAQSLVNYATQDRSVRPDGGGLPRWEQVNRNSGGMVGDGDDTIIADSFAFGANQFDAKAALMVMDRDAKQSGVTSDGRKVRGGLTEYAANGYVPGAAAVTLEYCNDDFALSRFAKALGYEQQATEYLNRAQNWKILFDPSTSCIRPRQADGSWSEPFSPRSGKGFVEGTASQYLWMVNFDLAGLIEKLGGNQKAIARLDDFFTKTNAGLGSQYAFMGNETCEEIPWVYDFAAAPWRTQAVVRKIQNECFTAQPSGLPGNDDAGALSSWYVFSALGIYPEIPGIAGFVVGSPMFSKASIHNGDGKTIEIIGHHASDIDFYVQGMNLNGQVADSPWIPWAALSNGGTVQFGLGAKPSNWGSDPSKAPPSFDAKLIH